MTQVEKRYGGSTVIKLNPVKDLIVAKMLADSSALIALLSKSETMGEFEEQQRLLDEFQASHRAIHVINGTLSATGETILVKPTPPDEVGDKTAVNLGSLAVGQALSGDFDSEGQLES